MWLHPIYHRPLWRRVGLAFAAAASASCRENTEPLAPDDPGANAVSPAPVPPPPRRIAFVSTRDGNAEIYAVYANGNGLTRLTFHRAADRQPAWSPDGQKLAFVRAGRIWVMNPDGSGKTQLSSGAGLDSDPVWSPTGQQILFRRRAVFGLLNYEVFVINADGSAPTNLSQAPLTYDGDARWSPDGTRIVFVSGRDGNREIYRMAADGSDKTRLTSDPLEDFAPQWWPAGDRIAFLRGTPSNRHLYFVNADGSNLVEPNPELRIRWLTWSPDGTRLAAVDDEMGLHVLTAEGASVYYDFQADTHYPVVWSPDGNAIAMSYNAGPTEQDIFVLREADLQAGTVGTNITNSPGWDYEPAWRP